MEVNSTNYVELANNTCAPVDEAMQARISDPKIVNLLHAAIGCATETGEIQDALKRHVFYGKELDEPNLVEELGDVLWYVALLCHTLNVDLEDAMKKNIEKLAERYPDKFTQTDAINRNTSAERVIFEESTGSCAPKKKCCGGGCGAK
jgi:NTP pyrophosphatase (non-canonical NTP hydrolase)